MAFYIYSQEGFPGTKESGRHQEYAQVLGVQIMIPAKTWIKLASKYTEPRRHQDWKDDQGIEPVHFGDEIAHELDVRFGFQGLVIMADNAPGSAEAQRLEKVAERLNLAWRQTVVQDFLREREKAEITGHGRVEPTSYERECFKVLELEMPNTVGALKREQQPIQVTVQLTPEMIAAAETVKGAPRRGTLAPDKGDLSPQRSPGEPIPR